VRLVPPLGLAPLLCEGEPRGLWRRAPIEPTRYEDVIERRTIDAPAAIRDELQALRVRELSMNGSVPPARATKSKSF
jgi:hypothetical protein